MTKSTITREQITAWMNDANYALEEPLNADDAAAARAILAMGDELLAAMDGEPVAYMWDSERKDIDAPGFYRPEHHFFAESNVKQWGGKVIPLYRHAQPAPLVHVEVASAIEELKRTLVDCNRYNYCSDAVARVEGACRAAMLQAEPVMTANKLGNSPVIPDGYVMVAASLLSELRDWAHPEIEEYCEMWVGRRDDEFPALRKIIADADALLAAAPHDTPALNSVQSVVTVSDTWIPVSERMPEDEEQYYLTYSEGDGVCRSYFFDGYFADQYITHWMPLLAAPQEVKGE